MLLPVLICCVAIVATAAPLSPVVRAEIDGLLARLATSGLEFNRPKADDPGSFLGLLLRYRAHVRADPNTEIPPIELRGTRWQEERDEPA